MIKLVITDLDDTLYSWIGFFIPAFYEMVKQLSIILDESQETLLEEYRMVHQEKGNVEYPFATLNLPSVKKRYVNRTDEQIREELNEAFHKFNSMRKKLLKLYPEVEETLKFFRSNNITIVGYTESTEENGYYRLKRLGIENYFKKVYVSNSLYEKSNVFPTSDKTQIVYGKKPNASILKEICVNEGVSVEETMYIGDSLSKDMLMAKQAGVLSVWCDFPKEGYSELYEKLVKISHWKDEDFKQEMLNKEEWLENNYTPDYTIHNYGECKTIVC